MSSERQLIPTVCVSVLCPQSLKTISDRGTSVVCGLEIGKVLVDPFTRDWIWVMYGYNNINEISQYDSIKSK